MKTIIIFCSILILTIIEPAMSQTVLVVTKTTDPDPFEHPYHFDDNLCDPQMYGTLQWAIRKVNDLNEYQQGSADSIRIIFNIPGNGPHVIHLNFDLPPLSYTLNTVTIDGTSQPGYIPNQPSVIIESDNSGSIQGILNIYQMSGCTIRGIEFTKNGYYAIMCYASQNVVIEHCVLNRINRLLADYLIGEGIISIFNSQQCMIRNNIIGTDIQNKSWDSTLNISYGGKYGINIIAHSTNPRIGVTSSSNTIYQNIIANASRGIWVQKSCYSNRISQNRIFQCSEAIRLSGDANYGKQPPTINYYQNDTLYGTSQPGDIIEVFGSNGDQQANEFLGSTITNASGNWQIFIQTTYPYVVATATEESGNSSNLTLKYEIKTCLGSVCFEEPNQPHCPPFPYPTWCTNKIICLGDTVKIYFCEMCEGADEWNATLVAIGHNSFTEFLDFTFEGNEGIYEFWSTYFIPQTAGYYLLNLYLGSYIYNLTLTVLSPPIPNITQYPILCEWSTSTLDAGSGYSSYLWNTGDTTQTISISQPGTYIVTVYDNNGCRGIDTIDVIQHISPTVTIIGNSSLCPNQSTTLTAQTNATSILWSTNATSQSIIVNQPGTYSVTVTNAEGCTNSASINVTQSPPINLSFTTTNVSCYGGTNGSATVNASGATPPISYSWSSGSNTTTADNLPAGTYSVTVTDANGCTATSQVTITQPSQIQYSANVTNVSCFGENDGTIFLSVWGGTPFIGYIFNIPYYYYQYQWNTGATSQIVQNLSAGTYTCTITDANGCTAVAAVTVTQPPKLQSTAILNQPTCYGESTGSIIVNATGGTPPYSFQWIPINNDSSLNNIPAGTYWLTITDANGCKRIQQFQLNQPPQLILSVNAPSQLCSNATGTVTATVSGGTPPYSYNWNGPNPPYPNSNQINATPGNYQLIVTDISGCTAVSQTVTIQGIPLPEVVASISETDPCSCTGAINIHGETGYSYLWSNGETVIGTDQNLQNLCEGVYYLTVSNNGCSISESYTIQLPASFYPALPPGLTYNSNGDIVVTANTTIATGSTYDIPQNIIINNGVTLVISNNTTLRFRPLRGLKVNPQATLNITQSTLTSICPEMWNGVNVVYMTNNPNVATNVNIVRSFIYNAINGIFAVGKVNLQVSGSEFKNNWTSIDMRKLMNPIITANKFITDIPTLQHVQSNPIYDNPKNQIFMHYVNINDINNFHGNFFINFNTFNQQTDPSIRGIGLYMSCSKVKRIYSNQFKGLWYGIYSTNSSSDINSNSFSQNNRGILISGGNVQVMLNTFDVGNNGNLNTPDTYPFGLGLKNCSVYEVQENTFQSGFIGMIIYNTQGNGLKIYKNTFDGLNHAFVANGVNNVKLTCNDFGLTTPNTEHNILMYNGSIFSIQDHAFYAITSGGSINTHNRFATDKDTWLDAFKFSTNNPVPGSYTYYWGIYDPILDRTHIYPPDPFPNWTTPISTIIYNENNVDYCPSQINGSKSVGTELFAIDEMKTELEYRKNYYYALIDNGNTDYFLSKIAILAPNNFTKFYNELMSASPYLSDTVLIAFMTHPINKPAHKKNVVLANSPLPFRVRTYINQMNVNQNFKNQIWAAQNGIGPRQLLENELLNRDYGINSKFGDLLISALLVDTIPEKVDTILNYVLQKGTLAERITTAPVFISRERYTDATANLNQINYLNETGSNYIDDFIDLQNLFIQLAQTPDSLRDSLIISNRNWLYAIANDSLNFCQSDAVSLLEAAYDTLFPVNVYVGSNSTAKKLAYFSEYFENNDCGLQIHPNPANNHVNISVNVPDEGDDAEIRFYDTEGKLVQNYKTISDKITINLMSQKPGVYYLILMNKASVICSKKLVIE